jgi:hypothetical protein
MKGKYIFLLGLLFIILGFVGSIVGTINVSTLFLTTVTPVLVVLSIVLIPTGIILWIMQSIKKNKKIENKDIIKIEVKKESGMENKTKHKKIFRNIAEYSVKEILFILGCFIALIIFSSIKSFFGLIISLILFIQFAKVAHRVVYIYPIDDYLKKKNEKMNYGEFSSYIEMLKLDIEKEIIIFNDFENQSDLHKAAVRNFGLTSNKKKRLKEKEILTLNREKINSYIVN